MEDLVTVLDDALDLLHVLQLEDGRQWGQAAAPFQHEDARFVLDPECSTPYHYLTRSRGSSKTSDLAAFVVVLLLTQLGPGDRTYGMATDHAQARILLDAALGFIRRTPVLSDRFVIGQSRITAKETGASFEALASDAPGAWGLLGKLFLLDEAAQHPSTPGAKQMIEAITSSAAKLKDSRMVVLTTAGAPSHHSHKLLRHAQTDPLWRVHEVPGPAPWLDRRKLEEQRRRLPESSYLRLFENQWVESEDMLTTVSDLGACTVLDGPVPPVPAKTYVLGCDIGWAHDPACVVIAHAERITPEDDEIDDLPEHLRGMRVVCDRVQTWKPSKGQRVQIKDVAEYVLSMSRLYNNARVIFDPAQFLSETQRLADQGVNVEQWNFSSRSNSKLAVNMITLLRNHAMWLPDDPGLIEELAAIRLQETSPGVLRLQHDSDKHDDQAIALALCAYHLVIHTPREPLPVVPWELMRSNPFSYLGGDSWGEEESMPYARTLLAGGEVIG